MNGQQDISVTEVLAVMSERRSWIKRYLAGEQDAVLNEVLSDILGRPVDQDESEQLFGSVKRTALSGVLSAVNNAVQADWPGAIPHIHVC
jgi:hypothetical protein